MQLKTIVITGPESTGKSTLAAQLADHFNTQWVPEYARTYIDQLDRPYCESDLLTIAKGQFDTERQMVLQAERPVFLDTSLEVIKIWSEKKYGRCHPWITEKLKTNPHDLYLLCQPDIPWQFDPQREHPNERKELFNLYRQELTEQNTNFVLISGLKEKRLSKALQYVEPYFHIPRFANHAQ
ncbi:MAG: ATP-binding protein [Bacteroidota bacterium]